MLHASFESRHGRQWLGWLAACLVLSGLASCNLSQPPAKFQNPPAYFLKVVAIARKGTLAGYFSLADAATNQVASDGSLRI